MNAIVVSPHPDDETLGACGTVMKLISQGAEITWLNITDMKPEYGYSSAAIQTRSQEIQQVQDATGYSAFYDLGFRPAGLEQYAKAEIIMPIKEIFDRVQPELVFLPSPHDAHSDHRVVYECALACTKAFRAPYVKKVLCMDILSESNYSTVPQNINCYVDIGPWIEDKLRIASFYRSEIQDPPFPRSRDGILAQAKFRGNACFCEYAEAFQIVKEIIS